MRKAAEMGPVLLLLAGLAATVWSQDQSAIGYFSGGGANLTALHSTSAVLVNVGAGVIISERVLLGLAGDILVTGLEVPGDTQHKLGLWYGGLQAGYRLPLNERVALTASTLFGVGQFRYLDGSAAPDRIGAIEPSADLTYAVTGALEVGVGATYRVILKSDYLSAAAADGAGLALFLRVGEF